MVGLGYWGRKVAREYLALAKEGVIDSVCLCDSDPSLRGQFTGLERSSYTPEFRTLLGEVQAVHICTPNISHFALIKQALSSKVHVLVEKPLTLNSVEAFDAVESSLAEGVVLQVGNIFRFSDNVRKVKEIIESSRIGNVKYLNFTWSHRLSTRLPSSSTTQQADVRWDLLPHVLDIMNFLTHCWPIREITSEARRIGGSELPNVCDVALELPKDIRVNIQVSLVSDKVHRDVEVVGDEGCISSDVSTEYVDVYDRAGQERLQLPKNNTIRAEISNFVESVRTGENRINSGYLGASIVNVIESIVRRDAVETKSTV